MKRALYLDTECQSTLNGGSLPYEGELLDHCPSDLGFSLTQAVVVSGASWNPCGYMATC